MAESDTIRRGWLAAVGAGVLRGSGLFASERARAQRNRGVTAPTFLVSNMSKDQPKKGRNE